MNKKTWIIIIAVIIILGIGALLLFGNSNSSYSNNYQAPVASGNSSVAQQFGSLNLTPTPSQTDVVPSTSSDIPSP